MTPAGRAGHVRLAPDTRGSVYVEFLIVILPLLFFILALVQTALMYVGHLAVKRSANTAVRSAVVVLDDDPSHYGGAPRNSIAASGARWTDPVDGFVRWFAGGAAPPVGFGDSARLQDIRAAASIPLLAVSPPLGELVNADSVYEAVGGKLDESRAAGSAMYNRGALAVTFPTHPGADTFRTSFGRDDDVTVRVTYLYHCGVPLVRYVMCESLPSIKTGVSFDAIEELDNIIADSSSSPHRIATAVHQLQVRTERLGRWRGSELMDAEAPWLIDITAPAGARYFVMSEEATLPNQGARYSYEGSP
jgi:hypothetical protein